MAKQQSLVPASELAKHEIRFPDESAEYRRARNELLAREIELRRATEAVAVARRALPPGGLVPEDYVFDGLGADGKPARLKLSELFTRGRDSLIVYNFMFPRHSGDDRPGPTEGEAGRWKKPDTPCPSCTAVLDTLDRAAHHVEAAGFNFAVVAKASLDQLLAFGRDRGWRSLRLLSAAGNTFQRDYHGETADGPRPIMNVFRRRGDVIEHFWSSEMTYTGADPGQNPRHNGTVDTLWNLMDMTAEGRPSDWDVRISYEKEKPAR